jgi:hypothetical protein
MRSLSGSERSRESLEVIERPARARTPLADVGLCVVNASVFDAINAGST